MAFNRQPPAAVLITVLFLMGLSPLRAQNFDYYMELRFIQRLSWIEDEYAMRYEVIIEKKKEGGYERVLRMFTEANFINISLSPGQYRCQVIPHDFLDQPIPATEWADFEVLPGNDNLETGEQEIIIVNPGDETNRAKIKLAVPKAEEPAVLPPTVSPEHVPVRETAPKKESDPARLWTAGLSAGVTSEDSWETTSPIVTVRGTIAPFRYSFLELGFDFWGSIEYYFHYAFFLPFAKGGIYAGVGMTLVTLSESYRENNFLAAFTAGVNIMDVLDISYTFRTNLDRTSQKVSVGYTYRFR